MRFWDSSAIVTLLVDQPATAETRQLLDDDPDMVVWWGTPVACASAVSRLRREGGIDAAGETAVLGTLRELEDAWHEVTPAEEARTVAYRLLRTHPLRAADALQLAAALVWAGRPSGDVIVTFDERLTQAARLEGFRVVPR